VVNPPPNLLRVLQAGLAHHQAGRLDDAEACYRKVLNRAPSHPDALNLMGVISHQRGRPVRAVQLLSQALAAKPDFPEALTNLARAQRAAGDVAAAVDSARQAAALAPTLAEAHLQLGRALLDLDDNEAAAESCLRAATLAPASLDAQVNLGAALTKTRDYAGAARAYQAALNLHPVRVETLTDFATVLTQLGAYTDALKCHERAMALAPNSPRVHAGHAATLKAARDIPASVDACRRSLALAADNPEVWLLLGGNLAALGQFEEAISCHRKALELQPDRIEASRRMAAAGAAIDDPDERDRLRAVAESADAPTAERISACFALGTVLDKAGQYDEAFQRFAAGNRLARNAFGADGRGFDRNALTHLVDRLIEAFPADVFAGGTAQGNPSDLPVFVVGMPRSGTTLAEQILVSHSLVAGAGELTEIGRIATALGANSHAFSPADWDPAVVAREADAYLRALRQLDGDAVRITDKMPDNLLWLGLIAVLFPRARVIVCRRDLRDVCLSCYFQRFGPGLSWSCDLEDCAFRAQETERLWRHWRAVLPLRLLELHYETLIGDLEGQSRRMIEFLGLPWDPACLSFHETERQVMTASLWQVRQPLYASSAGRWQHYRRHLAPLLAGLAGIIPPPDAAPAPHAGDD